MIALHRNFGVPPRGPLYEPPSKFGNATICEVKPPSPHAMTASQRRWSLVPAAFFVVFTVLLVGFAATSFWNAYAAYADHERTCALSHHTFTNCGE